MDRVDTHLKFESRGPAGDAFWLETSGPVTGVYSFERSGALLVELREIDDGRAAQGSPYNEEPETNQ